MYTLSSVRSITQPTILAISITYLALMPVSAQNDTSEQESIPRIEIQPPKLQTKAEKLEAYTSESNTNYLPSVHSELALDVAAVQVQDGDYHLADQTLRRAIRYIKKRDLNAPISLLALHDARATIAISDGEIEDAAYQLHRALNVLEDYVEEDHPLVAQVNFKLAMINWSKARVENNFAALRRGRRMMRRIRDNEAIDQRIRDMAGLVFLASEIDTAPRRDAGKFLDDVNAYVDRISAQRDPTQEASDSLVFAHLLKMRVFERTGEQDKADAVLVELNEIRGDDAPELLVQRTDPTAVLLELDNRSNGQSEAVIQSAAGGNSEINIGLGGVETNTSITSGFNTSDSRLTYLSPIAGNYVDAQFCVDQEGRVTDYKVVDSHGSKDWVRRMGDYVKQRRYLAQKSFGEVEECHFHYERFTVTSERTGNGSFSIGSRIIGRRRETYVARVDLLDTDLFNNKLLQQVAEIAEQLQEDESGSQN